MFRLIFQSLFFGTCLIVLAGCEKTPPPGFRFNAVEWKKQERIHLSEDEHFNDRYKTEIGTILTSLFGTPDNPDFPFLLGEEDPAHEIISLENLSMAAGPVLSDRSGKPSGLYREHCVHCHGVTGDGAGPTAALLNPYPRDFRMGKFKFKSTPLRQPPPDHDLATILENGIPGTAMPSFRTLPPEQINALVQYVKYLTIRGQYERYLLSEVAGLDDDGLSFIDPQLNAKSKDGAEPSDEDIEEFEDQMFTFIDEGLRIGIIERWLDPEDRVSEIPPAPPEFDLKHADHREYVDRGRALFFAKGNCMQCHGDTGVGDGQLSTFDDWTNDWVKPANADPYDPTTYQAFTDVGALPPRPIRPRNLNEPGYRGGGRPSDIYLRVANGIEGTPMPASSAMASDEVWAIVAYVQSLPFADVANSESMPVNDKQVRH